MKKLFLVTCRGSRITGCTVSVDSKYFVLAPALVPYVTYPCTLRVVSDPLKVERL